MERALIVKPATDGDWAQTRDFCYRTALSFGIGHANADEVAQSTVERLLRSKAWPDREFPGDEWTRYVHRATVNTLRSLRSSSVAQAQRRRRYTDQPAQVVARPQTIRQLDEFMVSDMERDMARHRILDLCSAPPLTQRERQVVCLMMAEGYSGREVAELLGVTTRRVRAIRESAHAKLRELLAGEGC